MGNEFYLELARRRVRIPLAAHLVLHELTDPEAALLDGTKLAAVAVETAQRYSCPLAFPLMDLTLEKDFLLRAIGFGGDDRAAFHFKSTPSPEVFSALEKIDILSSPRMAASCASIRIIAEAGGPLPVGMAIGPFSLLTKLVSDPIIPIYLAGSGVGASESDEVGLVTSLLPWCEHVVMRYCEAQLEAGARAIFICEPAANDVFFSPNQLDEGSPVFSDFVIEPNRRIKTVIESAGADFLFHDCGSLSMRMVEALSDLHPALLSVGSAVKLWEIEPHVADDIVLFGNLPTKKFYSDEEVPLERIPSMVREIEHNLEPSDHPYIIASECDILSMKGYESIIKRKIEAFCTCR
jgi:uroporphyrinogen-III decarboxylase